MQRDFSWGGMGDEYKIHLVGWDKICVPMENGSLGIKKLTTFNKALLGKWLCRFGIEETRLWRSVIAMEFGEEWGGWTSKLRRGSNGCGLRRSVKMGWETFSHCTWFEIGLGNQVQFWQDYWCGHQPLKLVFLVLYVTTIDREASIKSSLVR